MSKKLKILYLILIGLVLVVIDQLCKWLAITQIPDEGFFIWNKYVGLELFENEGIAFGIPMPKVIFYVAVFLILYFLLQKFTKELKQQNFLILLSLTFILAGAISNLIDRIFKGAVIDYIHIYTSVFNLADIYIIAGIIILIWMEFKSVKNK